MTKPNSAIKTLSHEIYEAIGIGRKDLQLRMPARHLREDGSKMCRAK